MTALKNHMLQVLRFQNGKRLAEGCTLAGNTGDMQHSVNQEGKGNPEEIHILSDEEGSSSSESVMLLEDKEGIEPTQRVYDSIY